MSVRVMTLVWEIELPDSEKLVLLALADCANDEGGCWPSMKTLAGKCSKSDRTVQAAIKSLVEKGHLSRIEQVGKGCHYYVHPVRPSGMQGTQPVANHYTYRITSLETGEFYLGARSSYDAPLADRYMGSGEWVKKAKASGLSLRKEIVETYPSREALAIGEQELTRKLSGHPLCRNKKVASARNLPPFGGLPPEAASPRSGFAPKPSPPTPEGNNGDPRNDFGLTVKNHQEPSDSCPSDDVPRLRPEHIVEEWNKTAPKLGKPLVRDLTDSRRQLLKARSTQYSIDDFLNVFGKIERSPFLRGDTGWHGCNFDWVFKRANFQKIIEGNYDQ